MVKIISYSNKEGCSTYEFDKKQEMFLKLKEFLKAMGEKWAEKEFQDPETGKDARIGDYCDMVRAYEYKECTVFLFFGMYKLFITIVYDKKNKEKVKNKFIEIFNPELIK